MSNPPAFGRPLRSIARFSLAFLSLSFLVISVWSLSCGVEEVEAKEYECPAPSTSTTSVSNVTVESSSRSPAENTKYEVTFCTPEAPEFLSDSIVMVLDEDIGVPRVINPFSVRIKYSKDDGSGGHGTASAVELGNQDDPRRPTTITIYPAIAGAARGSQPQPIPADAKVTVTFRKEAGISNPTEGGAHSWTVHTDKNPTPVPANHPDEGVRQAFHDGSEEGADTGLLVEWEIQLTHEEVGRGDEVTVIGRGYKNGTTLTFWRDANFDGVRDTGEEELCRTLVDGNDIGYCSFTVSEATLFAVASANATQACP